MKCLNCGCETDRFLCESCRTEDILDKVVNDIFDYCSPNKDEYPYIAEVMKDPDYMYNKFDILPQLLQLFDEEKVEYYECLYLSLTKNQATKEKTYHYVETHDLMEDRTQRVLYLMLNKLVLLNLIEFKRWFDRISETEGLSFELYCVAADYYSKIGEYDISDSMSEKAMEAFRQDRFVYYYKKEYAEKVLNDVREKNEYYRTQKPYWPATYEGRMQIVTFYDKKGIEYPRIEPLPEKTPASEFQPLSEYEGEHPIKDYCTFWCEKVGAAKGDGCVCWLTAVKVRNGEIADKIDIKVKPWDSSKSFRQSAAKKLGISLEELESGDDRDIAMKKFLDFVGDDILVSTEALSIQGKLLMRIARYSGLKEIKNDICDLLDVAADISEEYAENNSREYLLSDLSIKEGDTPLARAEVNKDIYENLLARG